MLKLLWITSAMIQLWLSVIRYIWKEQCCWQKTSDLMPIPPQPELPCIEALLKNLSLVQEKCFSIQDTKLLNFCHSFNKFLYSCVTIYTLRTRYIFFISFLSFSWQTVFFSLYGTLTMLIRSSRPRFQTLVSPCYHTPWQYNKQVPPE